MTAPRLFMSLLPALLGAACGQALRPRATPAPAPAPASAAAPSASASTTASAPRPPPAKLTSRAADGDIGTADPVLVEAVARDGGWVVFCQARAGSDQDGKTSAQVAQGGAVSGDRLQRYFAKGAGPGESIDELLARDGSGRWLVIARADVVSLVDTHKGVESDLTALGLDARDDSLSFRAHRALAFDPPGERLAYLRGEGRDARIVVRALGTGAETVLDPGGGDVWRIEIEPTGRFVVVYAMVDDTNHDKRVTWPAPVRKARAPCRGPVATYDAWVGRGDTPVVRLVPLGGGTAESVPGYVTTLGNGLVLREPSGKLLLREGSKSDELSGEKCGARVVLVDHAGEQLLVACTKPKGRPKLELVGRGPAQQLDVDVAHQSQDQTDGTRERLFALYPGNDTKLLDLVQRRLSPLSPADVVLASHGPRALVRRKGALLVVDVERTSERALDGRPAPSLDVIAEPPLVAAAPLLVSLATETVLGTFAGRPLGLAPDGKVLVARGADADGDHLAQGPLVWRTPAPMPSAH